MPKRIQLSRKKGSKLPPNTVNVARPGRFGNPFNWQDHIVGNWDDAECKRLASVDFEDWLDDDDPVVHQEKHKWIKENLHRINEADFVACWCKPSESCHADILIRLANKSLVANC